MSITIFYSWQSDLPSFTNRSFIQNALEKAVKKLNQDKEIIIDVRVEKDTQGVPGSPDIAHTIFDKISNSHIFVGDISIINRAENPKRFTPNPNVLVELGYAARHLGWDKIICIFNSFYGDVSHLPFDIVHRRILFYEANETGTDKEVLTSKLKTTILAIINHTENLHTASNTKIIYSLINELAYNYEAALNSGTLICPFETINFDRASEQNLYSIIDENLFNNVCSVYRELKYVNKYAPLLMGLENSNLEQEVRNIAKGYIPHSIRNLILQLKSIVE